jgi:hypothetical protein
MELPIQTLAATSLILFLPGVIGCSNQLHSVPAPELGTHRSVVDVSSHAVVSNKVGFGEHQQFVRAIIESADLETNLPEKVKGTPYAMDYFSMSRVAPELFSIVSRYPDHRNGWIALSKVHSFADGEYGQSYDSYRIAAQKEFPAVFFTACPDWDSLIYRSSRGSVTEDPKQGKSSP